MADRNCRVAPEATDAGGHKKKGANVQVALIVTGAVVGAALLGALFVWRFKREWWALTPEDTAYLVANVFSIVFVMALLAAFQIAWFHTSLVGEVERALSGKVNKAVQAAVQSAADANSEYLSSHFYEVASAADLFASKLYQYFSGVLGHARDAEAKMQAWNAATVGISEYAIVLALLAAMFAMARVLFAR